MRTQQGRLLTAVQRPDAQSVTIPFGAYLDVRRVCHDQADAEQWLTRGSRVAVAD